MSEERERKICIVGLSEKKRLILEMFGHIWKSVRSWLGMRGRVYKVKNFRTTQRKKHRYNKWKDGWEKIEPSKVPRWVLHSGVQPDYFQCVELKGKHYRYLICSEPRYQGDKRLTYYRKLRRKWRKKRKHKKR